MNKKALYESIMKSVAKEVKKALRESELYFNSPEEVDNCYDRERLINVIKTAMYHCHVYEFTFKTKFIPGELEVKMLADYSIIVNGLSGEIMDKYWESPIEKVATRILQEIEHNVPHE